MFHRSFLASAAVLAASAGVDMGSDCTVGGEGLCSCSELVHKKLIDSIDDCSQAAAVAACEAGTCYHEGAASFGNVSTAAGQVKDVLMTLPFKYHNALGPFDMSWGFPSDDTIEIEMTLPTSYYMGIGLTEDGVGDTIAGWVGADGKVQVRDYWDAGNRQPETDEQRNCRNDVVAVSGSETGGFSTIRFRRKLDTGDNGDCDVKIIQGIMHITYAWCDQPFCADDHGRCNGYEEGCLDSPHTGGAAGFATIDFSGKSRSDDGTDVAV